MQMIIFGGMPYTRVDRYRTHTPSLFGGCLRLGCTRVWNRVVGQAFSLSNDTESAVATMLKQVGSSDAARFAERCARLYLGFMEGVLYGSV